MSLYQRGNVWWVDAYHEGQRIRASCRTVDREEAEFRYQQMLNAQPVKNRATLSDAERLVIESHAVKGVTNAATRDADRGMICSLTAEWVLSELRAQRYSCAVS